MFAGVELSIVTSCTSDLQANLVVTFFSLIPRGNTGETLMQGQRKTDDYICDVCVCVCCAGSRSPSLASHAHIVNACPFFLQTLSLSLTYHATFIDHIVTMLLQAVTDVLMLLE